MVLWDLYAQIKSRFGGPFVAGTRTRGTHSSITAGYSHISTGRTLGQNLSFRQR